MFRYPGNNNSVSAIFQSHSWDDEMKATVPAKKSWARRHLKKSSSEKVLLEKSSSTSSSVSLPSSLKNKRTSLTVQTVDLNSDGAVAGSNEKPADGKPAPSSIESGWTSPKEKSAHLRHAPDMSLNETEKWSIITASEKPTVHGMIITFLVGEEDDISMVTAASGLVSAASSPTGSVDSIDSDLRFNKVDVFGMTFKLK